MLDMNKVSDYCSDCDNIDVTETMQEAFDVMLKKFKKATSKSTKEKQLLMKIKKSYPMKMMP